MKFIPVPDIGSNPTTGLMVGVAPGAYWLIGDPANTSLSSALESLVYTSNKQLLTTAKANTFFAGDKWNMMTDIRYFITSQPTYGLGIGPQSAKPEGTGFADYTDNMFYAAVGFSANDCFDIGSDLGSLVSADYYEKAPFKFNGTIETTKISYPKK